tara:strand:+ start:92 stop:664 length:573 start_codon:yes stop_codon:yes gene_type:complete
MKTELIHLPIFPLPVFLLPKGITRLRIFEPRYLKMVSVAVKGQGFVICLKSKEEQLTNKMWGSWVEIINFDQGKDGILEVDVKCKSLVELQSVTKSADDLYYSSVTHLNHWSTTLIEADSSIDKLSKSLLDVFEKNNMLMELYPEIPSNNAAWIVARWLELLPIVHTSKNNMVNKYNFEQAKDFVHTIIY